MPRVIFTAAALDDLKRLRAFLRHKNPSAVRRAASAIVKSTKMLEQQLHVGRPVDEMNVEYRELPIDSGDSDYVTLYRQQDDTVVILSLRHQKEAGYR